MRQYFTNNPNSLNATNLWQMRYKRITCHQAQRLVDAYILNDPSLTIVEREAFEAHLQSCSKCAQEYEESKWVIEFVKEYWPEKLRNRALLERANHSPKHLMTIKEGWKDLLRRCPDLAVTVKRQKRQRLLRRISAVAACLVIGVFIFLAFSIYSKPKTAPKTVTHQVALAPKPSVRIELVSQNGSILIPTNQQITSNNEFKTLVTDGKHRMVMNTNTVLAVEPLVGHGNIGCLVKLDFGQIYSNVKHDGNPFIIDTVHGKAVITGTTFDLKVTDDSTTLVVSEGTVRFESEEGTVRIAAGQMSEIVGQSAPSVPLSCNTAELTAWATGHKTKATPAGIRPNLDTSDLEWPAPFLCTSCYESISHTFSLS